MNNGENLSDRIREKIKEYRRQNPECNLAGRVPVEPKRVLNPDIDREAFSEIRKKYEKELLQLNQTCNTDSNFNGSADQTESIQNLNRIASLRPISGKSGLKNRIRKLLNRILRFGLSNELERVDAFINFTTRSINQINHHLHLFAEAQRDYNSQLALFGQSIVPVIDEKVRYAYELLDKIMIDNVTLMNSRMDILFEGFDRRFEDVLRGQSETIEWLKNTTHDFHQVLQSFSRLEKETLRGLALQHKKLEKIGVNPSESKVSPSILDPQAIKTGYSYYLFENEMRGSEKSIEKMQLRYLSFFQNCDPVVDVGCGRGEFLEILRCNDIRAFGIDPNPDMVSICQEKGLDVQQKDGLTYLEEAGTDSIGGVFIGQVVEHLAMDSFIKLLDCVFRALKPGGKLVFETINTASPYALCSHFFKDPTHTLPRHPETYRFWTEITGFGEVTIEYISPITTPCLVPSDLDESIPLSARTFFESIHNVIHHVQSFLFAPCDVVICAIKPSVSESS